VFGAISAKFLTTGAFSRFPQAKGKIIALRKHILNFLGFVAQGFSASAAQLAEFLVGISLCPSGQQHPLHVRDEVPHISAEGT
jgi:hypothetical protein